MFHFYSMRRHIPVHPGMGGGDGKTRHRGYARQSLAAKPVGQDALQVFKAGNLAGGVTGNGQFQVFSGDAATVILHADAALAAVFKANIYLVSLGVQAVFHQFLQHAGGPFNHFASGDLVAQLRRQQTYMTFIFRHGSTLIGRLAHGKLQRHARKNRARVRHRTCLAARGAYLWKVRLKGRAATAIIRAANVRRGLREGMMHNNTLKAIAEPLRGPLVGKGYDPELLYVECGRCGSPVMWEQGKATHILGVAGIDPLELDASCLLVTDACPTCGGTGHYTVQIFRVSGDAQTRRPPYFGNA